MLTQPRPQQRLIRESPEEVAASLRHLPGFMWFDTAGRCPEADRDGAISILTALPTEVRRGRLGHGRPLAEALGMERQARVPSVDWGLPVGGWFGCIDYDGSWEFARCDQVLVHRHATGEWLESGDLSALRRPAEVPEAPPLAWAADCRPDTYAAMVRRAQDYIAAGDIYQVNLAHRFEAPWPADGDAFALHLRLRTVSPAPFAAFMDLGDRKVVSSSPESFLRLSGNLVRTRPIKGTRPRFADPVMDERSRRELLTSAKERAELVMITDLLRNDLGMVCEYGSVHVTGLLQPEVYEQVHHLVSTVQGTLRPDVSHAAALEACFPGGSITGAPKRRAMEIIRELESVPRGLYTGAIGWFGANAESHFSIAIRTIIVADGVARCHAGAGIVADSVPEDEWRETLHKASGMLAAGAP